jgi:hypothetical protein
MHTETIDLAKDFSPYPFGRYPSHGRDSGERFRDQILAPRLSGNPDAIVVVDFTGVRVHPGSSFVEEAFGGLVRVSGFKASDLEKRLRINLPEDPSFEALVAEYIRQAAAA